MKTLLTRLELPWDKFIPILHYSFMLYNQRIEGQDNQAKTARLTMELISSVTYLSQNGRLIHNMAGYYGQQIQDLEKLMGEAKKDAVVTEITESDSHPL